jgi:hypothetical protein
MSDDTYRDALGNSVCFTTAPSATNRVFTCTDHAGHWVGVASVVVAPDEPTARDLLRQALTERGLKDETFTLTELDTNKQQAIVLQDGDY